MSGHRPNAADLDRIAALGAEILASDPDPATVAVTYLHPQSAHPNAVRRYEPLFGDGVRARSGLKARARRFAYPLFGLASGSRSWSGDLLPERADVLLVSHFLRPSQAASGEDLYFGDLPEALAARGLSTVVVLIDQTGAWPGTRADWRAQPTPRVLLSRVEHARIEWRIGWELAGARRRIVSGRASDPFERRFRDAAAEDTRGSGSHAALRIGGQIGALVARLRPRVMATTYEGHSWERIAYAAARRASPDVCRVGYHHAVLFPHTHALKRTLGHGFDPDIILTAGEVTRDRLRAEPSLSGIPIDVLGSARTSGAPAPAGERAPVCLVLPEGIASEATMLFGVALQAARLMPEVTFRLRLHPVLARETVVSAMPALAALPENVMWSSASLDKDLRDGRWALYRGSSIALQAALAGVRPFYFSPPDEPFGIDPLEARLAWPATFSGAGELAAIMEEDGNVASSEREAMLEATQDYCQRYFMPLRPDVIAALVDRKGGA